MCNYLTTVSKSFFDDVDDDDDDIKRGKKLGASSQ